MKLKSNQNPPAQ